MQLPSEITFRFARLEGLDFQPNNDGGKVVLTISVPLTPSLAGEMSREEMLYDSKGVSREFTGAIGLTKEAVTNLQVRIECDDMAPVWYSPEKIRGFKVVHGSKDSEKSDTQIRLEFLVHLSSEDDIDHAFTFVRFINKDLFGICLKNRQMELFDGKKGTLTDEAGTVLAVVNKKDEPKSAPQTKSKNEKSTSKSTSKTGAIASVKEMETATAQ